MSRIEIKFLGTGGVFDFEYGNSSAIVSLSDHTILLDCGPSVYPALCKSGAIDRIDSILLTHLHGDHSGGIFPLILHLNLNCSPQRKARLLYPSTSFQRTLAGFLSYYFPDLDEHVEFVPLSEVPGAGSIDTTDRHIPGLPSYAYYFLSGDELVYYSGDLGDVGVSASFLAGRRERSIRVFHELHYLHRKSHCHYWEVMSGLKGHNVLGYHVDPRRLPADNAVDLVVNHRDLLLIPEECPSVPSLKEKAG